MARAEHGASTSAFSAVNSSPKQASPRNILTTPTLFFRSVCPEWEPRLRLTGLFLQLFDLGSVTFDIREIRKLFKRPTMREIAKLWEKGLPKFRRDIRIIPGVGYH